MRAPIVILLSVAACSRSTMRVGPESGEASAPSTSASVLDLDASAAPSTTPSVRPSDIPKFVGVPARPQPVPPGFGGIFHLRTTGARALGFRLFEDGTFFWRHDDCICTGGGGGTWSTSVSSVVLTARPAPPSSCRADNCPPDTQWRGLTWEPASISPDAGRTLSHEPSPLPASRVVLVASAGGLDVEITWLSGGTERQRWDAGQVCPVCRQGFSPGALPAGKPAVPCNDPTRMVVHDWGGSFACH